MATPVDPERMAKNKAKQKERDHNRQTTEEYRQKQRNRDRTEHWKKQNLKRKEKRRLLRDAKKDIAINSRIPPDRPKRNRKYKTSPTIDAAAYRREIKYGLSPEQFSSLLKSQGYRCAICRSDSPRSKRGWNVDHDHNSGKVRGILCNYCNPLLGQAQDKISVLKYAIVYLKKHQIGENNSPNRQLNLF